MTGGPSAAVPRVAYLVSQYPALSHAFIETEVEALRDLGVVVQTFSVRAPDPADLLTDRARREAARTTVLQRSAATVLPRALLSLLRRSPGALRAGAFLALRSGPRTLRSRIWQFFYLAEAVILWWRMTRAGVRRVHVHFANSSADIARLTVALGAAVDGPSAGWSWSLAMHGPTEFEDLAHFDLRRKVAAASAVACISDFSRSQVMKLLPPADWPKVGLVRMSVDAERFSPAPPADDAVTPDAPLQILSVGRLVPEKGAPLLLDAVARVRAAGSRVVLTVVGAGPLRDELAADVRARGLDDVVHLAGPIGQERLPDLYRVADVFCLPSFAEGLPVVLMEAMASGLPVVTTAIAGIPELVVDHRTGIVVPAGRADLIARALAELAGDPELARDLGVRARAAVRADHDPALNARRLVDLLGLPVPRPGDGAAPTRP